MTGETLLLNLGPHHPSTHGVLRLLLMNSTVREIISCIPDVGYLHTGIEKTMGRSLTSADPYRPHGLSRAAANNTVFSMAIRNSARLMCPSVLS
ncbi:MAG: hypothetical protein U0452_06905 [Anaerolineae bacterium]